MAVYILIELNNNFDSLEVLSEEKVIGRNELCDITLSDELISGMHCSIKIGEQYLVMKDLNSKNGTYLNGIKKKYFHFYVNDIVTIGNAKISIDTNKTSGPFLKKFRYKGDPSKRNQDQIIIELERPKNSKKN